MSNRLISSGSWSFIQGASGQFLSLLIFLVLGRLLDPKVFGVVAAAQVVLIVLQIAAGFGSAQLVVKEEHATQKWLSTVFWTVLSVSLVAAVLTSAVALGLAYIGAVRPLTATVVSILTMSLPIASAYNVPQGLLLREMRFKTFAMRTVFAQGISGVIGIVAALLGCGVWSLVLYRFSVVLTEGGFTWHAAGWRPSFVYDRASLGRLLAGGTVLSGVQLLAMVEPRVLETTIGSTVGTTSLAFYVMASRITEAVTQLTLKPFHSLVLPHLRQDEFRGDAAGLYSKMTRWISWVTLLFYCYLIAFSDVVIRYSVGPKWLASAPLISVIGLNFLTYSVFYLYEPIFIGLGLLARLTKVRLIQSSCVISCAWAGLILHGIIGCATGQVVGLALSGVFTAYSLSKNAGVKVMPAIKRLMIRLCIFLPVPVIITVVRTSLSFKAFWTDTLFSSAYWLAALVVFGLCERELFIELLRRRRERNRPPSPMAT